MPLLAPSLPLDSVKMDDRKRPAPDDHSASRVKRQAVAVNGAPVKAEDDLPRDDDLDVRLASHSIAIPLNANSRKRFTKDAILRQMKEYKREKHSLETQLAQVNKRSAYHDDHLRIIDGWFLQVCIMRPSAGMRVVLTRR